jgi:hypothetical protein
MFERWGCRWECLRGYAVTDPAGWWFELRDVTDGATVLFASWPDDGELRVSQHRVELPPGAVEWFTAEAREAIGPVTAEPHAAADRGHGSDS